MIKIFDHFDVFLVECIAVSNAVLVRSLKKGPPWLSESFNLQSTASGTHFLVSGRNEWGKTDINRRKSQ